VAQNASERDEIAHRYLKFRRTLAREAISRLVDEDNPEPDSAEEMHASEEDAIERPLSLNEQRVNAVLAALKVTGAKRVLDLGCGEGKLLRLLLADKTFEEIVGMDVSHRALEIAEERLHLDRLPARQRERLKLIQGSLTYRDRRLAGFDAATVVEVIEHLDAARLAAFERVLFEFARPENVIMTTPNAEYNVRFETLPAGKFRHKDHRFEWTRGEFQTWSNNVAKRFGYAVRFLPIGAEDAEVGAPTQMGVFTRGTEEA
jgi:3' terminal RNA ribose 2'-O-methyltransferase Hen1